MAFSVSTKRSRSQDSPTFWLSLLAGSLVLHLVLLLLGRWYFSQTVSVPAGNSQAAIDFVEIDPNATPLKQPVAPSKTAPQNAAPKAAPPESETATPEQSQRSTIENLARQTTPERSRPAETVPSPSPITSPRPTQPPRSGQLPTESPRSNPTTSPRPTTNPSPIPGGTTSPQPSTPGTSTPGTSTPSNPPSPSPTSPGSPNPPTPGSPSTPSNPSPSTPGDPNASGATGEPLAIATSVRGEVYGSLQEDPYRPEQYAKGTVTLKSDDIPEIKVDFGRLPVKVLDLKLGLAINSDGAVTGADVRNDSPSLLSNPALNDPKVRQDIQSIVDGVIFKANAEGSLTFNIKLESSTVDAFRIMSIRLYVEQ